MANKTKKSKTRNSDLKKSRSRKLKSRKLKSKKTNIKTIKPKNNNIRLGKHLKGGYKGNIYFTHTTVLSSLKNILENGITQDFWMNQIYYSESKCYCTGPGFYNTNIGIPPRKYHVTIIFNRAKLLDILTKDRKEDHKNISNIKNLSKKEFKTIYEDELPLIARYDNLAINSIGKVYQVNNIDDNDMRLIPCTFSDTRGDLILHPNLKHPTKINSAIEFLLFNYNNIKENNEKNIDYLNSLKLNYPSIIMKEKLPDDISNLVGIVLKYLRGSIKKTDLKLYSIEYYKTYESDDEKYDRLVEFIKLLHMKERMTFYQMDRYIADFREQFNKLSWNLEYDDNVDMLLKKLDDYSYYIFCIIFFTSLMQTFDRSRF